MYDMAMRNQARKKMFIFTWIQVFKIFFIVFEEELEEANYMNNIVIGEIIV